MEHLDPLVELRHQLHQQPELSGQEQQTAQRIKAFLQPYQPDRIIEGLGGHGLAAIYEFAEAGPGVLIRCELDALPIAETLNLGYASQNDNISHKCGHDGHMSIVAGLAAWLHQNTSLRGRVILLFQPAEETGHGAQAVLEDPRFQQVLQPDYCFALHNIPGYAMHQVLWVPQSFSASVMSVAIQLQGVVAHAATPEKGHNPALAMAAITQAVDALCQRDTHQENFTLITPIYTRMGQKAYGTSAGEGELHYTLRTWSEERLQTIRAAITSIVDQQCRQYALQYQLSWFEHFPASLNDSACNQEVVHAAQNLGLSVQQQAHPFKFGEDFGWLSQACRGALFGLGAGTTTPPLHHPDYDFPDELILTGVRLFQQIIVQLLGV